MSLYDVNTPRPTHPPASADGPPIADATPEQAAAPLPYEPATVENFPDFVIMVHPEGAAMVGQRIASFPDTGDVCVMLRTNVTPWGMVSVIFRPEGMAIATPETMRTALQETLQPGEPMPPGVSDRWRFVGPSSQASSDVLMGLAGWLPPPFLLEGDHSIAFVTGALDALADARQAAGLPLNVVLFPD